MPRKGVSDGKCAAPPVVSAVPTPPRSGALEHGTLRSPDYPRPSWRRLTERPGSDAAAQGRQPLPEWCDVGQIVTPACKIAGRGNLFLQRGTNVQTRHLAQGHGASRIERMRRELQPGPRSD